jgi:hypothetical protein
MAEMPFIPEFKEAKERSQWIINNAEYFTIIRRKNRRNLREEAKTLDEAIQIAQRMIAAEPDMNCLIYGVWQNYDTLAATLTREGVKII